MDTLSLQKQINSLNYTTTLKEDGIDGSNSCKALAKYLYYFYDGGKTTDLIDESINNSVIFKQNGTLDVPYVCQRGFYRYSYRMCSISCILMVEAYFNIKEGKITQEDIIKLDKEIDTDSKFILWANKHKLFSYVNKGKLEQISYIMSQTLSKRLGFEFKVSYSSIEEIKELLDYQIPLITSTRFPGRKNNNFNAGHYITIIGYFGDNFIINDPYGLFENDYNKTNDILTKGEKVLIPKKLLFGKWGCKSEKDDRTDTQRSDYYRIIKPV